ncbi:Transcription termination factor MTEF18, mitochondrial-like protein [Drosera capensis]
MFPNLILRGRLSKRVWSQTAPNSLNLLFWQNPRHHGTRAAGVVCDHEQGFDGSNAVLSTNWMLRGRVLRWVSSQTAPNSLHLGFCGNHRHYGRRSVGAVDDDDQELDGSRAGTTGKVSRLVVREAQAALLDYLHATRSLQFLDAEHMSKKSPNFLKKLLGKVDNDVSTTRSLLARFFRYHPINEFEPFFESIGLDPDEFIPLLPREFMFLSDDADMMENYYILCNYGISRDKIGKVYKEAREVFGYGYGVLLSKLQAYDRLGLSESMVQKVVTCSPHVLVGDVNEDLIEVLRKLESLGFGSDWVQEHLLEENSYHWRRIREILIMLGRLDFNDEELEILLSNHPDIIFDQSGGVTASLVVFLFKLGTMKHGVYSIILQLPQLRVGKVFGNLRHIFDFLVEIEMKSDEIGEIIRVHAPSLGSCPLKKTSTILQYLATGKRRLCEVIREEPLQLKNWIIGAKMRRLPNTGEEEQSRLDKIKFLKKVGFPVDSPEISKALKVFRGKGLEIQERFDCLVNTGLNQEDVINMIKMCPQILNLTLPALKAKIDYLVNDLGYPVTSLESFPAFISYNKSRVELRLSMYKWLVEQKAANPGLSLSTIVACTEKDRHAGKGKNHNAVMLIRVERKRSSKHEKEGLQSTADSCCFYDIKVIVPSEVRIGINVIESSWQSLW